MLRIDRKDRPTEKSLQSRGTELIRERGDSRQLRGTRRGNDGRGSGRVNFTQSIYESDEEREKERREERKEGREREKDANLAVPLRRGICRGRSPVTPSINTEYPSTLNERVLPPPFLVLPAFAPLPLRGTPARSPFLGYP